jgi:arabinogalactan oligomer/maltooligosaccharide transport system permease protein
MKGRRGLALWFLLPSLLVLAGVVAYPFAFNLWISLTNWNMFHFQDPRFQGLDHYAKILGMIAEPFTRPPAEWGAALAQNEFYRIFGKTFAWTAVNLVFHFTLGLGAALLLNRRLPARGLYRALLILPWAMPQYISALTWRGMFNVEYGVINQLLAQVGLQPVPWFSSEFWAFMAPTITNIWLGFPFIMVIALGGLQSIPQELYEAARIDGAGPVRRFFRITLPMLKPVLLPALVLGTIWTFNNLNVIWLVTDQGLPADKTHILVTYVYKAAFFYYRYGYAAAFSVFIFLVLMLIVRGYDRVSRREVY